MKKFFDFLRSDKSLLIGLISLVLTIYQTIITKEPSLEFTYKILSTQNSFYNTTKKILFKVKNDGNVDLKYSDYANVQFGLKISNANIIDNEIKHNSNKTYILNELKINCCTNNTLNFSKIFFDTDGYFEFTFNIVHNNNSKPQFIPLGKISGLNQIKIYENKPLYIITYEKIKSALASFFKFFGWWILFAISYYSLKYFILFLYSIYEKHNSKNLFDKKFKNLKNLKNSDFDTFHFFYKINKYQLELVKKLLIDKNDLVDYYNCSHKNIETKKYSSYTIREADHHVREKGSGSEDEYDIYYSELLYKNLNDKFFEFSSDKKTMAIKEEKLLISYIDAILEYKFKS